MLVVALSCGVLLASCQEAHAEVIIDMEAIKQIESGGNVKAYNVTSEAVGWFQITPICLLDFNVENKQHYRTLDLFSPQVNSRVATWYMDERIPELLKARGIADSVENRLIGFNCGVGCVGKPLPSETANYLRKYKSLARENAATGL